MGYNLLNRLRDAGLEYLIPQDLRVTASGDFYDPYTDEGYGPDGKEISPYDGFHSSTRDRLLAEWNAKEEEEEYWTDIVKKATYRDQEEEDEIEGRYAPEHEDPEDRPETLYDLKVMFGREYMSDDDFLTLKISDLYHVTDGELKFLDDTLTEEMSLDKYLELMEDEKVRDRFPSPEKRIRYCQMEAVADTTGIALKLLPFRDSEGADLYTLSEADGNAKFMKRIQAEEREQLDIDSEVNRFIEKLILNQNPERAFNLLNLYADYLTMYPYALYRNTEKHTAGQDDECIKYTLFPKVSHLKDIHDKAMRDYNEVMSRIQERSHDLTNKKISMQISTPEYKRFLYRTDGFNVIAPQKLEDLQNEGKMLNHCVASYISPVANGKTKIYFIRKAVRPNEPYYTAEIKQNDDRTDDRWYLMQCYTYNDSTRKDKATRDFIRKWCKKKKIIIKCKV